MENGNQESAQPHNFYFTTDFEDDLILHWGLSYKSKEWVAASSDIYPQQTKRFDGKAVQTKFIKDLEQTKTNSIRIHINVTQENPVKSLNFVFNIPGKVTI